MLLQIINDRMNGKRYTANERYCLYDFSQAFHLTRLANAFDMEDNRSVRRVLCSYVRILVSDTARKLKYVEFINSCNWL